MAAAVDGLECVVEHATGERLLRFVAVQENGLHGSDHARATRRYTVVGP
jgi:hypothetical protein